MNKNLREHETSENVKKRITKFLYKEPECQTSGQICALFCCLRLFSPQAQPCDNRRSECRGNWCAGWNLPLGSRSSCGKRTQVVHFPSTSLFLCVFLFSFCKSLSVCLIFSKFNACFEKTSWLNFFQIIKLLEKRLSLFTKFKNPATKLHFSVWFLSGPDPDDVLDEGVTNSNGEFSLKGSERELTPIDPVFKVYHDCDDGIKAS